ncbi:MAG: sensor histidine kinase N-terminal domain-containing protein [Burkholderiaceae bacterium]
MPEESVDPAALPAPHPPSARPGWRANMRALAAALTPGAGRRPAGGDAAAAGFNPLRRTGEQRSLFGEILDWMLAPLLLLWPMSVTVTYLVAQSIANAPYDRTLGERLELLADHVKESKGQVALQVPMPVHQLLHADPIDSVYYMVLGLRGEFIAGERDLPLPEEHEAPTPRRVKFRSDHVRGTEVRIAYTWVEFRNAKGGKPALVQVAETLEKRSQLANEIIRGVIVPQFVVLPIAVVLVWFGLSRGLAPLAALQARIRARRPDDLSPIDPQAAPEELAPLVNSFNELLGRMAQNLRTQRRFTADAAHQMKTPLAGLRTQAELALRETDPQQLKRSLRQIAASTERATHLINQLLALARAEHHATDLRAFTAVDLVALSREVLHECYPLAQTRRIDLGFEAPEHPVRIIGMAALVRELLKNLVDNALRYTPEEGRVTVRVRTAPGSGSAFLEVEDTGPGIAEHERPLVFERFYRVLGTNVDGSGLGLAIVREIAEQHDALLRVGDNPRSTAPGLPGTLISVEFTHTLTSPPTLRIG